MNEIADVEINGVNKWYPGDVHAVSDMYMEIHKGEFLVFVGPSGCGKTTLLRMIAGLEAISSGTISMGGRVINKVAPKNRDIAMVFQNYALYPTMKVKENIAFPLKMHHTNKKEAASRIAEVAEKLELKALMNRKPAALSGGQRQRVALARAMVRKPRLFLMDEPLSNLDAKLRTEMRREIVSLQRELRVTTVYVTHDQTEAMTMGTRIAVMNEGVLQQIGTPKEIYRNPKNLFVAGFIGSPGMNVWDTEVVFMEGEYFLALGGALVPIPAKTLSAVREGKKLKAAIRPEHIIPVSSIYESAVTMKIDMVENSGREAAVFLSAPGSPSLAMVTNADFEGFSGEMISVCLRAERIHLFDAETGAAVESD